MRLFRNFFYLNRIVLGIVSLIIAISLLYSSAEVEARDESSLLLYSQFGELCTMCEAVVQCENTNTKDVYNAFPQSGQFTLYHLKTRTFWSQISTIWEFFIKNFNDDAVKGHRRPVNIIKVDENNWSYPQIGEARISIDPNTIYIEEKMIDRESSQWIELVTNNHIGFCYRLPLWESLEIIEEHNP